MKNLSSYRVLVVTALLLTLLILAPQTSFSNEKTGIDVVLVMDSSGSMKKTDPISLRIPAAKMFISLLDKNDRAAVISFSDKGYPIIHLTVPDGNENKDKLTSAVNKISSKGAHTNLYDALVKGQEIVTEGQSERNRIIILMTDGMMDTGNKKEDERLSSMITDLLVKEFEKLKITVYTIAFTEHSDAKLLQGIAAMTGGVYSLALSDKDLHQVFASIFESAKKPEMLPIDENGLLVDKSIEELTIVASKSKPDAVVAIELPGGKKISSKDKMEGAVWFSSPAFDMVTVQKPVEGRWKIHFSAGSDKAYIVSNMKMMTDFDKQHLEQGKGINVKAWFEQDGSIITKQEILETTEVSLELAQPAGEPYKAVFVAPKEHNDGVLSAQFTPKAPGHHGLRIVARGKTFERERGFKFDVTAPAHAEAPKPVKQEVKPAKETIKKKAEGNEISWLNLGLKVAIINILIAVIVYGVIKRDRLINLIKRKKDA